MWDNTIPRPCNWEVGEGGGGVTLGPDAKKFTSGDGTQASNGGGGGGSADQAPWLFA